MKFLKLYIFTFPIYMTPTINSQLWKYMTESYIHTLKTIHTYITLKSQDQFV